MVTPHHPLGQARRAACIDEEQIIAVAFYFQRRAIALVGQGVKALGEIAARPHLNQDIGLVQGVADGGDRGAELLAKDHHPGV